MIFSFRHAADYYAMAFHGADAAAAVLLMPLFHSTALLQLPGDAAASFVTPLAITLRRHACCRTYDFAAAG